MNKKWIINYVILTLKNQRVDEASLVTEENPFEYIEQWNSEHLGTARAKLISYQDCTKEWNEHNKTSHSNFKGVKPDHKSNLEDEAGL